MIKNVINYDNYTYDTILDKYSETGNKRFLSFCYAKSNNFSINDLTELFNSDFNTIMIFLFNTQRLLDGEPIAISQDDMYNIINPVGNNDEEDLFDF